MTALGTLSTMTVISVRGGIQTGATDRARGVALYAAESGAAVAMDFLRTHLNAIASGATGNPLGADTGASYTVTILNNRDDTGFVGGLDADKRVVIHAVGYGPGGATAAIEWDVVSGTSTAQRPCNNLAQKGQGADNAGLSDCLGAVSGNIGATY